MRRYLLFFLLTTVLISCQEESKRVPKNLSKTLDSLVHKNDEKDSIIDLMLTQLNDIRVLRYADKKTSNTLYGGIKPEPINDIEMAELINGFDTTISHWNGHFYIRILKACNGQADLNLDYCNCSDNIYISTGAADIPEEYYLFRIGPYMEAKIDSLDRKNSELIFSHQVEGKTKKEKLKINLTKIYIEE